MYMYIYMISERKILYGSKDNFAVLNGLLKKPSSPLILETFTGILRLMRIDFYICISFSVPGN